MSSNFLSIYLTTRELHALNKVGDIVIPGGAGLPAFSQTGCISHVDVLMAATPAQDLKDFKLLLKLFSVLPDRFIRGLLMLIERNDRFPEPIGGLIRMLGIGINGVVFSLYYSNKTSAAYTGPTVHQALDYQVYCEADEAKQ